MLLVAPLGRLGLEGTHPPAPKAPSKTLCAAIKLCVAPGTRGEKSASPQGTSLDP